MEIHDNVSRPTKNLIEERSIWIYYKYVEISDIITDDDFLHTPGRPAHHPIHDISQWVERFSITAAIICTRFPDKASELLATRRPLSGPNAIMKVISGFLMTGSIQCR